MHKISRADLEKLANTGDAIGDLFDELEVERELFEGMAARLIEQITEAKEEAREIMDDAAMEAESYYDERSEKWQEGERGERYAEWRDRLREIADALAEDVDAPEVTMPDRPDWVDAFRDPDFAELED